MTDINLLPEDLRARELAARKAAANNSDASEFSKPLEKTSKPDEGSVPGRWQQLISALKKNIEAKPALGHTQAITRPAMPSLIKSSVVVNQPAVSPTPQPPTPVAPAISPTVKAQTRSFSVSQRSAVNTPPPTVLDVNLLPAQEGRPLSRQAVSGMIFMIIGALVIVAVAYFSLRILVDRKTAAAEVIQQEVVELQQQLENARATTENAITVQSRIKILAGLLDEQGHWQGFFSFLEKNTIPVVQLTTLAADANGKITISGVAPNFTEIGRQMLAYEQSSDVSEVTLSNIAIDDVRDKTGDSSQFAKFTFSLTVAPDLFITRY